MKWLFLFLLLTNIGLFIWTYPQYQEQQQTTPVQPADVERLQLLSEVRPAESEPGVETEPEPALGSKQEEEQMAAETSVEPQMTVLDPLHETPETTLNTPPAVEMESESAEARQAEPVLPSEQTEQPPDKEAPRAEKAEQERAQCARLGPVAKRVDAEQVAARLVKLGLKVEISTETRIEESGYWVLVPQQASRNEAIAIVERLKKAGIKDLWRFTSGTLAHAISLGLFRDEERAEVRRKIIADKGFEVEVRPRSSEETDYWLNYRYTGSPPIAKAVLEDLKQTYSDLESRDIACRKIASP